ncbi:MAG: transcription termination/antitermination protein NusA [Spirochaetes bacterium]|nr:transcription termination/antitermination protein NusA [Spirochaetota bacterium]
MKADFSESVKMYSLQTGVPEDQMLEAIAQALVIAYKKKYNKKENVAIEVDQDNKDLKIFAIKTVVEKVNDPIDEISLVEAKDMGPDINLGDEVKIEINPETLGRIAAKSTHQIIMQNVKKIEGDILYNEFSTKRGEIVTGLFQRRMRFHDIIVDLGKTEALLPVDHQMYRDKTKIGEKVKVLVKNVEKKDSIVRITLSRTDPEFVIKLFYAEVPEIAEGIVVIKGIAREAGERTKIAVYTERTGIDPVGACVGMKGVRIQSIIRELDGEKIDIVKWDSDIARFLINLLSPAKLVDIKLNEKDKTAIVVVPSDQLSSAIGKDGKNVKLAAKLAGWTMDIKSEEEFQNLLEVEESRKMIQELFKDVSPGQKYAVVEGPKEEKGPAKKTKERKRKEPIEKQPEEEIEETSIDELPDISPTVAKKLKSAGYDTIESIIDLSKEDLLKVSGISKKAVDAILKSLEENVKVVIEEE